METDKQPNKYPGPDFFVKLGESTCEVNKPEKIYDPSVVDETLVLDESFGEAPVTEAKIWTEKLRINGFDVVEFSAEMTLSDKFEDQDGFEDKFMELITSPDDDLLAHDLVFSKSELPSVARVTSSNEGNIMLISSEMICNKMSICVSNNTTIFDESGKVSEQIMPNGFYSDYEDLRPDFEKMLITFMSVMAKVEETAASYGIEYGASFPPRHYVIRAIEAPKQLGPGEDTVKDIGAVATSEPESRVVNHNGQNIMLVSPKIKLDDIGGLRKEKEVLKDLALSLTKSDIMKKWGVESADGLVFHGPPGCGKTMMVEALAHELGAEIWYIQSSDIYGKWMGESESRIKNIFDIASTYNDGKMLLVFDEIDSIITTETSSATTKAVAGIFKQEMNTLSKNPNVFVAATSNRLEDIDPALVRAGRFSHSIYLPLPDHDARTEIALNFAINSNEPDEFSPFSNDLVDFDAVASATEGHSGADLNEIFRRALMKKAVHEVRTGDEVKLTTQDLLNEVEDFRTNK